MVALPMLAVSYRLSINACVYFPLRLLRHSTRRGKVREGEKKKVTHSVVLYSTISQGPSSCLCSSIRSVRAATTEYTSLVGKFVLPRHLLVHYIPELHRRRRSSGCPHTAQHPTQVFMIPILDILRRVLPAPTWCMQT